MKINKKINALEKIEKPIALFSEKYCKNIDFRTAIKSLPVIGGYLDNLFAYKGSKIIQERINSFFDETAETLKRLSDDKIDKSFTSLKALEQNFQQLHLTEAQLEVFCTDLIRYSLLSDSATRIYDAEKGRFRSTKHAVDFLTFILSEP